MDAQPIRGGASCRAAPRARVVVLVLMIAAVVAGLAAGVSAQEPAGDPLEGQTIRAIKFEGTYRSSEAFLREQIRSKIGELFLRATLDDDVKRLYLSGRVNGDIEAYPVRVEGGVEVHFVVTEREIVREIEYPGLDTFGESELRKPPHGLRLTRGRPYEEHRARLDERLIVDALRTKGRFFAEVDREVKPLEGEGGGVTVIFHVREGPKVRVSEIQFEGNRHVEADELRKYMKTQTTVFYFIRSGYFQRKDLDQDLERMMKFYRGEGFLDVRVFVQDIAFDEDRERVTLTIRVVEGDRYKVRNVEVRGTTIILPEALARDLETKPGDFFSGIAIERDRRAVERRFADKGYIFASARSARRVVEGEPAVDLVFEVKEGGANPIRVDRIRIDGNWKTRDDVIRRELSLLPGDAFYAAELDESRDRIGRRGLFKDLAISFEPGTTKDSRDLVLRVEEADTGQILFGGGVSSSSGFFGRVVYQQRNFDITAVPTSWDDVLNGYFFAGGGQRLTIQAEPGSERSTYRVSFVEPYLLPRYLPLPLQFRTSFSFSDSLLARSFIEQRLEWSAGLGYRTSRDSLFEVGYRVTSTDIFDIDDDAPADVVEVAGDNLVSAITLGFRIDRNRIDQHFNAYSGWGLNVLGELAGGPWGGDFDFWRFEADANWQTTLFQFPGRSRHVFALRGGVGLVNEYGRSNDVPIFERYFAGGPRSVRGFEVRSVGPQEDDEPVGGKVRMIGSVEYSFPIIPGFDETYAPFWRGDFLRGVLFVDAGNVESEISDFTFDDFRVSAGIGVRIKIPIFPQPLALDFGFPLRQQDADDEEIFSLSVGTPF